MANLKGRLEKLESTVTVSNHNHCVIVHRGEDCAKDREQAIAAYVAEHGGEPERFINIHLISPATKQSICGCSD
jgi:hypothetical protein